MSNERVYFQMVANKAKKAQADFILAKAEHSQAKMRSARQRLLVCATEIAHKCPFPEIKLELTELGIAV